MNHSQLYFGTFSSHVQSIWLVQILLYCPRTPYVVFFEATPSKSSFNPIWGSNISPKAYIWDALPTNFCTNGTMVPRFPAFSQVWRSVPLHISRKRVRLMAPGICSYVAASCGGAVGRLCLTIEEDQSEQDEDGGPQAGLWGPRGGALGLGPLLDSSTDGETLDDL